MTTSTISNETREALEAVAEEYDLDEQDAFVAFCWNQHITADKVDSDTITEFTDSFVGVFLSGEDFAHAWALEEGMEHNIPSMVWRNIDWDGVWETDLRHDYYEVDGFFFRNI